MTTLAKSIDRWWANLENHLQTLVDEGHVSETTMVGALLNSIEKRCTNCGVPFAFHKDKDCERIKGVS